VQNNLIKRQEKIIVFNPANDTEISLSNLTDDTEKSVFNPADDTYSIVFVACLPTLIDRLLFPCLAFVKGGKADKQIYCKVKQD